jgi:hypothetical protein
MLAGRQRTVPEDPLELFLSLLLELTLDQALPTLYEVSTDRDDQATPVIPNCFTMRRTPKTALRVNKKPTETPSETRLP